MNVKELKEELNKYDDNLVISFGNSHYFRKSEHYLWADKIESTGTTLSRDLKREEYDPQALFIWCDE